MSRLSRIHRKVHLFIIRKKLKNKNFTIISNNCTAGFIYHDLNQKFLSPTINLYFSSDDFVLFCKNLKYYLNCDVIEKEHSNKSFPVGIIKSKNKKYKDIEVNFNHYDTFLEAKEKWMERSNRVNFNNICYIFEFYDNVYDEKILKDFVNLKLGNKICLTHKEYKNYKNCFCVHCYNENTEPGEIFKIKSNGKRNLDEFDYISFINNIRKDV